MKKAFSLVEMLVVLVIVAMLITLAIPGIKAMQKSFDSTGAEGMISAALSTARTLAISRGRYAGVRFQKAYNIKDPQINAAQYMIFVINDEPKNMGNLDEGFRAVEGYKPIKLPQNVGVIDMTRRTNNASPNTGDANEASLTASDLDDTVSTNLDPNDGGNRNITDISAFSIVFSQSGKLVIHDVRIRNKKGDYDSSTPKDSGYDIVFNSYRNIKDNDTGQFLQDDYAQLGLGGEKSRREIYIYDRQKFEKMTTSAQRFNYISDFNNTEVKAININPYTGEIIK